MAYRILILDDNEPLAEGLAELLGRRGFHAEAVCDASGALERVRRADIDLMLLDVDLGDTSGAALLKRLREQVPALPVVLITARDSETVRGQLDGEPVDIVEKPITISTLMTLVTDLLSRCQQAARVPAARPVTHLLLTVTREERLALASPAERPLLDRPAPTPAKRLLPGDGR